MSTKQLQIGLYFKGALVRVCVCMCVCGLVVEGGSCCAVEGEVMGRMKSRSKRLSQQDIKVSAFFTHAASLYKGDLYLEARLYSSLTSPDGRNDWTSALG